MVNAMKDEFKLQNMLITQIIIRALGLFFVLKTAKSNFKSLQPVKSVAKMIS